MKYTKTKPVLTLDTFVIMTGCSGVLMRRNLVLLAEKQTFIPFAKHSEVSGNKIKVLEGRDGHDHLRKKPGDFSAMDGWMGAPSKNVKKYADIYNALGCRTIVKQVRMIDRFTVAEIWTDEQSKVSK